MNLVYYSQEDPRWRNTMYSVIRDPKQTIGLAGCGPTSFAMVFSSLTGRTLLPPEAAKFAVDHGHRTADSGTAWSLFADIAKAYGLTCRQVCKLDDTKKALATGALLIASMKGGGHFTRSGHFIVLTGAHGGLIDVMDPNHDNDNYKRDGLIIEGKKNDGFVSAKESVFVSEARSYWIFTYLSEEDQPMTKEEKQAFYELAARVVKLEEKVDAPDWFVKEFGSADLGGLIHEPQFTAEDWRVLTIGLRARR
ncbi:C39 family peptidase [Cohnella panacarvi]|uniref:C39 family peptidase n=1 Tax=Cohnella panacarvi TaxID=400776 RepID=UPI00047AF359|nr:C39 family peptidase [Cohnella panacarvi]